MEEGIIKKSAEYTIPGCEENILTIDEWMSEEQTFTTRIRDCIRCHQNTLASYKKDSRFYRACKECGLWQELGGVPYQCTLRGHACTDGSVQSKFFLPWDPAKICDKCGEEFRNIDTVYKQLKK